MDLPDPGDRIAIRLLSLDKRKNFVLDVTRARLKLTKVIYQNRARQAIVVLRLDLDGPPHRNPDGEEVPCPHPPNYAAKDWGINGPTASPEVYSSEKGLFLCSKVSWSDLTSQFDPKFASVYSDEPDNRYRKASG